jgi:NADP-dependent alcohol dehydrogenase
VLNFTFYNPTRIHFGKDRIKNISKEIPREARVMITYGGGSVIRYGVFDEVKTALDG